MQTLKPWESWVNKYDAPGRAYICVSACFLVAAAGDRRRRSGRRSGSRPIGSSCSCNRRPSRTPSTSRSPRTHCACRTALCSPCRTCSPGPKTPPRSAACRHANRANTRAETRTVARWRATSRGGLNRTLFHEEHLFLLFSTDARLHRKTNMFTCGPSAPLLVGSTSVSVGGLDWIPATAQQGADGGAGNIQGHNDAQWAHEEQELLYCYSLPMRTPCFVNSTFSYLMSDSRMWCMMCDHLCHHCLSVFICHVNGFFTQLQNRALVLAPLYELKHNLTHCLTQWRGLYVMISSSIWRISVY